MTWKRYLIIFINILYLSFPYNILGCGGEIDPYDYFTTFFQNDLVTEKSWHPFYYTNYEFLYDSEEPVFKSNKYFPQLQRDYGSTAFYKQAVNTCSYLKDFLHKQ